MEASFSKLVIEGDNLNVMGAILGSTTNSSLLGHIFEDILCYIFDMNFASNSCVKRGHMVAHSLARFARNIADDMYWLEDAPP